MKNLLEKHLWFFWVCLILLTRLVTGFFFETSGLSQAFYTLDTLIDVSKNSKDEKIKAASLESLYNFSKKSEEYRSYIFKKFKDDKQSLDKFKEDQIGRASCRERV